MRRYFPNGARLLSCAMLTVSCGCSQSRAGVTLGDDLLYVLQPDAVSVSDLTIAAFHWLVLEPSMDGTAAGDFTLPQISQIKTQGPCIKTMLAYLSIGEAEDYRDYWDPAWVDGNGDPIPGVAPPWLGPQNPDFGGNYKVRYWLPEWPALMFGTPNGSGKTPLDRIIDQGFDGVYLDIIDAYEFWSGPDGGFERTRMQARADMVDFVEAISRYARVTRGVTNFLVFPQNASDIIRNDGGNLDAVSDRYFAAISGIGQEDLFYDELTAQPPAEVVHVLDQLREFNTRGKFVLVTDYVIRDDNPGPGANNSRVADFYSRCLAEGFIPYAARQNRNLDEIVTLGGAGWSVSQPTSGCPACVVNCTPSAPAVSASGALEIFLVIGVVGTTIASRRPRLEFNSPRVDKT